MTTALADFQPTDSNKLANDLNRGFALLESGAAEQSLQLATSKLAENSSDCAWLTLQALSLSALRQAEQAAQIYRQLIQLEPEIPEHHANLGNALLELAHPQAARAALLAAKNLGDHSGNLYFSLARTALECNEPHLARAEVVQALQCGLDQDLEVALFYIKCLIALDEIELAKDNARRLMAAPMPADLACEYAFLVLQLSDYAAAEAASLKVPVTAPEYPLALISLGLSYERSNQMPKAHAVRAQLAGLDAAFSESAAIELRLASVAGQSLMQFDARLAARVQDFSRVAALLLPLLELGKLDANLRIALQFELARAFDALAQTDSALAMLADAHQAQLKRVAAAHPEMLHDEQDPLLLTQDFFANLPQPVVADQYLDPVFVVGFPRSGTTLLEQLLDAHPALQSFDEQPFLQKCILQIRSSGLRYPQDLNALHPEQIVRLRADYFAACAKISPNLPTQARYVDKNPLNLSRLPLIQAIFPQALVIVVLRHPADCVLSCYMQHFRAPAFAVTMQTLAHTAQMYHRVFQFYLDAKAKLQLATLELKYEDLVSRTETCARALFEFLQLPWSDTLMAFTERAKSRAISTPSYAAVTEKVNQRAVARHVKYADAFNAQGVSQILAPWLQAFGYLD